MNTQHVPYALAVTPFGSFAVSIDQPDTRRGPVVEEFTLTPIGDATALPISVVPGLGILLNHNAGDGATFTINGVEYSSPVTVRRMQYHGMSEPTTYAQTSLWERQLSDSAERKLADWFDANRDDLITPRLRAADELSRAQRAEYYAGRDVDRAKDALSAAQVTLAAASERATAALAAFDGLGE